MRTRIAGGLVAAVVVAAGLSTAPVAEATFPGDNGKIAFNAFTDNNTRHDIYVMNGNGTNRVPLTSNDDDDKGAAWSPDGTKIAFTRQLVTGGVLGDKDVWVMNANGSGAVNLTNSAGADFDPAWSPDGSKIVFASLRHDPSPGGCGPCNAEIFVMNANGTNPVSLTATPSVTEEAPDWLGTKITYVARPFGGSSDIMVANADFSGSPTNLTNTTGDDKQPAWWPDGSKIAFSYKPSGTGTSYDIYTVPAGGGDLTPLFTTPAWEFNPAPMPDGTGLAFDTDGAPPAAPVRAGETDTGFNIITVFEVLAEYENRGDGQNASWGAAFPNPCNLVVELVYADNGKQIEVATKRDEQVAATATPVGRAMSIIKARPIGGHPEYHWKIPSKPDWVEVVGLGDLDVYISGTPPADGEYKIRLRVQEASGCVVLLTLVVTVTPLVTLEVAALDRQSATMNVGVTGTAASAASPPRPLAAAGNHHDVRYRRAPLGSTDFGSFTTIVSDTGKEQVRHTVKRGFKHCFSARVTGTGKRGWGKEACKGIAKA